MKDSTVLIVEDTPDLLNVMKIQFEKEGYNVITAINGEVGFEMADKHRPGLIISDIFMPQKSGTDMLNDLRETNWGLEVPVIFMTNLNLAKDVRDSLNQKPNVEIYVKSDTPINGLLLRAKEILSP